MTQEMVYTTVADIGSDVEVVCGQFNGDPQHDSQLMLPIGLKVSYSSPLLADCGWSAFDPAQGYSAYDVFLAQNGVYLTAMVWGPREDGKEARGTPPHDHGLAEEGNWAVVVGLSGEEENLFWSTQGLGQPLITTKRIVLQPHKALIVLPGEIHSVQNISQRDISVTFHLHRRNPSNVQRFMFRLEDGARVPYVVNPHIARR